MIFNNLSILGFKGSDLTQNFPPKKTCQSYVKSQVKLWIEGRHQHLPIKEWLRSRNLQTQEEEAEEEKLIMYEKHICSDFIVYCLVEGI